MKKKIYKVRLVQRGHERENAWVLTINEVFPTLRGAIYYIRKIGYPSKKVDSYEDGELTFVGSIKNTQGVSDAYVIREYGFTK